MRVLVALKLSGDEEELIETALAFGEHTGAEILFMHVVDRSPLKRSFVRVPESMAEYLYTKGERELGRAKELAEGRGLKAETRLVEGSPVDELVREARRHDLVMMRSRVYSAPEKLGRATEKMVSRCPKPVMLVNGVQRSFSACLVPVDGSQESFKALYHIRAMRERYRFRRVMILLVHTGRRKPLSREVREEEAQERLSGTGRADLYEHRVILESAEGIVRGAAEEVVAEVVHTKLEVPEAILKYARKQGAKLIFMGARGRGARILPGSTSTKVITRSEIPVVVFPERYVPEG